MARVTVEDCIDKVDRVNSPYELVLVAKERATQLNSGVEPTLEKDNDKNTVIALREIADETISAEQFKQSLIEEYQSVSPIDEEELALEFDEENADVELKAENKPEVSAKSEETELYEQPREDITEINDKISEDITEIETDKSI